MKRTVTLQVILDIKIRSIGSIVLFPMVFLVSELQPQLVPGHKASYVLLLLSKKFINADVIPRFRFTSGLLLQGRLLLYTSTNFNSSTTIHLWFKTIFVINITFQRDQ